MKRDYHVLPHPRGWAVKREGNKRATVVCRSQRRAIANARLYAISKHVEVVIHRADGSIRDSDTYGREGRAKDRKH